MKRNKTTGRYSVELQDPVLLKVQVERYDKSWLDKEAAKHKWSVAKFIRYLINQFRNN